MSMASLSLASFACLRHPISPSTPIFSRSIIQTKGGFDGLHERRMKEARRYLEEVDKSSLQSLVMVDALQRLGVAYHFENEKRCILKEHHLIAEFDGLAGNNSTLYEVALRFRLLRQHGYYVPADIFETFKTEANGGRVFDPKLHDDVLGLMSLFEASHMGIQGDDILDEAADFSRIALNRFANRMSLNVRDGDIYGTSDPTLGELVTHTLSNPFHKSLPMFTPRSFQGYFARPYEWSNALVELATEESSLVKSIHQNEILQVSKWWKDLGLTKELKFARDELAKWCLWPMAMLPDPRLSQERIDLVKPIAMLHIIDDIFDVYGSLDELTLFADAIHRWECAESLPDYMKICFRALDDITNEISSNVYKRHHWNPKYLLRKSWARLCDALLTESRWFTLGHSPSADEYLKNAIVSSGAHVGIVHSFALLSECVNQQSLEAMHKFSGMSSSCATILRLWDDLETEEARNRQGRDESYVKYYMNDNPGCSIEEARVAVKEMIYKAWKSLNKECLFPGPFSPSIVRVVHNSARMVSHAYDFNVNHHLPKIQEYIATSCT